jgi:hypothetical protein
MNQKVNGHTDDFLKRQAKTIKKDQNITHVQALNVAAVEAGFNNYTHFLNSRKTVTLTKKNGIESKTALPSIPQSSKRHLDPHRNLLIAGTNELLKRGLISLESLEDTSTYKEDGYLLTTIFNFPSVVLWQDIGFEELRISVWWKYDHSLHPQAELTGNSRENFTMSSPLAKRSKYKKFVGATASAWLERKSGKYIMGKQRERIFDIYTRKGEKTILETMPQQKPDGYDAEGKFYF